MSSEGKQPASALEEVVRSWVASCLEEDPLKSEKDLEADARIFFRYLSKNTSVVTESNLKLETRSSHEESLVRLIRELGPAFSTPLHQSRVRGLHVLAGAIGGCTNVPLSNSTTSLIGNFLVGHCGPIDDDEYGEDYDSMIRDAAITALGALTATLGEAEEGLLDALCTRLQLSRQGIERRCAVPEDDAEVSAYGSQRNTQDIRGGLSTLTRSKRSICFSVIRETVAGTAALTKQGEFPSQHIVANAQKHLVEYARFASNCIHGESDPRCLLQLLHILNEMQIAFSPWFESFKDGDNFFPAEDLFDAVSPYYPIQFTPPPNDIHGITREDLHSALIQVLNFTKMDPSAVSHNQSSMLGLTASLYLEQMVPMHGDDSASTEEKQEALDCLTELLFPKEDDNQCTLLDVDTTRNLAVALESIHAESSLAVASENISQREQNKRLADDCRTLVSTITFHLEIAPNRLLFDTFVSQPLQKQARKIRLSPSHSKTSIAYIACLAASGRSRTLRLCLSTGLEPLLGYLEEGLTDEEEVTAAAHGVGAFFSSSRVASERARENGVALHPHPLEPYTEKSCKVLLSVFNDEGLSASAKIGAVRALESLLISSPKTDMDSEDVTRVCTFIENLLEATAARSPEGNDAFQAACGTSLGTITGSALDSQTDEQTDETATGFLSNKTIFDFIRSKIYPALLESALKDEADQTLHRHDRQALAAACKVGRPTAESVVSLLLENLGSAIEADILDRSCVSSAETLSYILRYGGEKCSHAYHKTPASDLVLTRLGQSAGKERKPNLRSSVANLALPSTDEERAKLRSEVEIVFSVVQSLRPAYEQSVPQATLDSLLGAVSQKLPPLSEEDIFALYARLPILGTILCSHAGDDSSLGASSKDTACQLLSGLTDFVMSSDYDSRAREAAASCMHAIIRLVPPNKDCPVRALVTQTIAPGLTSASDICDVKNFIQILGVIGSAAACRACSSSSTAAEIARFLVDLACTKQAVSPFTQSEKVQLSTWNDESSLEMTAASAFGSMLSGTLRPVIRQRLTHIGLQHVRTEYETYSQQASAGNRVRAPCLGLMAILGHMICCSDVAKMDKAVLHQMVTLSLEGMGSNVVLPPSARVLLLSSVLKLISVVPSSVSGFLLTVISCLLRAYAVSDPSSEIASKLLALQALERMASFEGARASAPTIKPAVVSILALALNHPSGLLRQAAVDVQNSWHVL